MTVFLIAAITADGFIAKDSNQLADWTSRADKKFFVKKTKEAGVILMGRKTFETIGKALPGRRNIVYTSKPEKFSFPETETTKEAPEDLIKRLALEGEKALAICGGASIYSLFLNEGLINKLYLTVEPVLFGQGISLLNNQTFINLKLADSQLLSTDVLLLEYDVEPPRQ
jgi:dihydrofolate reductase